MAAQVNIVIDQGTTFNTQYTILDQTTNLPIDFTTFTINSQMRKSYSASNSYSFTANGSNTGVITLTMSANNTANLTPGRYLYDIETIDVSGNVSRVAQGIVTVTPQVTR